MYWILASVALAALFYFFVIRPLTYWSRRGIPQRSAYGQFVNLVRTVLQFDSQADIIVDFFNEFSNKRYNGAYQLLNPVLFLRDPELIKQITVKDFDHFVDHSQFVPEEMEPLWGKNLFALKGDRWRDMRATLSPSFTSSKMRLMFSLMNECALQFVSYFKNDKNPHLVEMKDVFTRYANDVIATTAFGITCDSLTDRNNEFYLMGKEATNFRGLLKNIKFFVILLIPKLAKLFGLKMFSTGVSEFFRRLVKTNIESREKNGIVRPDMMHLLMEAKNGRLKHEEQNGVLDTGFAVIEESSVGKEEKRQKMHLTDDDLTAQALIFFFAGFESVSTLMCFLIYEIAVNPDIQEALRKEIYETLENCGGSVTYEHLLKMKYLDMVVSETLRKWPTAIAVDRLCIKPYTIQPVKEDEEPIHIKKDEILWVPIFGIHRNPELYPNPDRFDPERFSDENKANINPYAYLPFGAGPRSCIGNRYALLETKTIIFHILANFEVLVTETTLIPLKLATDSFNLSSKNGFWFNLKPRDINA